MDFEDLAPLMSKAGGMPDPDIPAIVTGNVPAPQSLVILSNRLPFSLETGRPRRSVSGLISSVEAALEEGPIATWLGWNGSHNNSDRWLYRKQNGRLTVIGMPIPQEYVTGYYKRVCNSYLFPIYTGDLNRAKDILRDDWEAYAAVNLMFSREACRIATHGATVWVNDFHLQLCPQFIKDIRPDLSVAYFHHIPFPAPHHFGRIRQHKEILRGIGGADRIGFQTSRDRSNHMWAHRSHGLGDEGPSDQKVANSTKGAEIGSAIVVTPAEIDTVRWRRFRDDPVVMTAAAHLRELLGDPDHIFLGVDRLEPAKGIPEKIRAFAEAKRRMNIEHRGRIALIQVAVSAGSRSLSDDNRIKDALSCVPTEPGERQSVYMTTEALSPEQLAVLYATADTLVVTSLSEGMNLVVKEFVAVRGWEANRLIISRLAGVAEDLPKTTLINPRDIDEAATAFMRAMGGKNSTAENLSPRFVERNAVIWMHEALGELIGRGA